MAKTAYSKIFQGEYQVAQLQDLHRDQWECLGLEPDFRAFVRNDVECPCCNVDGAIVVKEGFSSTSKLPIKEAHFAFRNNQGDDSHLKFCDFYSGKDKINDSANDCLIKWSHGNSLFTNEVRRLICAGIENKFLSQNDIRSMRLWFTKLRADQSVYVEDSELTLNILHQIIRNNYSERPYRLPNKNKEFEIKEEAYKLLASKISNAQVWNDSRRYAYQNFSFKGKINKAISIANSEMGTYTFDRSRLDLEYKKTMELAHKISVTIPSIKEKYGRGLFYNSIKSKALMAYAALLLFIKGWDMDSAFKLHNENINPITQVENMNLGNVLGVNPFINYREWEMIKIATSWRGELEKQNIYLDIEYNTCIQDIDTHLSS